MQLIEKETDKDKRNIKGEYTLMDDKIYNFSNKRIGYLDVVKALGIFFIYFAHFGEGENDDEQCAKVGSADQQSPRLLRGEPPPAVPGARI